MKTVRLATRWAAVGMATAAGLWLAGFALFLLAARSTPSDAPPHVDGIVALTGAPGRVDAALRLLADGRADRLLISGVAAGASLEDIAHEAPALGTQSQPWSPRVTLGHVATNTQGNAREAAAWAQAHDLRSLLVVTSDWHLPRAMAELARAMPDRQLYAMPVASEADHRPMASLAGWRLLAGEFSKWLVVRAGLEGFHPDRPRDPAPQKTPQTTSQTVHQAPRPAAARQTRAGAAAGQLPDAPA
jgi:uncharacterized SAM-binding protein YcdF (DUF218 family)